MWITQNPLVMRLPSQCGQEGLSRLRLRMRTRGPALLLLNWKRKPEHPERTLRFCRQSLMDPHAPKSAVQSIRFHPAIW
jgi:hypothetical protein